MAGMTVPAITSEPVVEVVDETDGEMRVRFPVVVLEGASTSDGRYLTPGGITHRALPLSVLAQPAASHGGNDPDAAVVIGRIDTLVRTPGPDVISRRTGEPFGEGVFVWSGEGTIDATHPVADLVRRRYLRGVSVDLTGMDVEMIEGEQLADAEHPDRKLIAHSAEISAVTLVPIPAFGDAYVELADETTAPDPLPVADLPEGLAASAAPAWRSADVGDRVALLAAGEEVHTGGMVALVPADPEALIVDGGDPPEQMHLTLAYLGDDVTAWPAEHRETLVEEIWQLTADSTGGAIEARIMGHAVFNPDGFDDREPCAVYLVGDAPRIADLHRILRGVVEHKVGVPEQHDPPIFHVTAGYGVDLSALTFTGPVVFDRLRVALGMEVTDFDLTGDGDATALPDNADVPADEEAPAMAATDDTSATEAEVIEQGPGGLPDEQQPCQYGPEPAVRSLLFRDEDAYVPVCDEHEQEARAQLDEAGETVVRVVDILRETTEDAPDEDDRDDTAVTASAAAPLPVEDVYLDEIITASAGDAHRRPPLAWFTDPGFIELTPITVDGSRVYGHIGSWDRKHLSFNGQDIRMPRSRTDYREFMRGGVRVVDTEGRERVTAVGHLTFDCGHADGTLSAAAAARFYDHSGFSWARVAAGEDDHGVWVAGILRPGITDEQIDTALAHPPSGDWRQVAGNLELVSVLCVSVPGFGVARSRVASGQVQTLVASGGMPSVRATPTALDTDALAEAIAVRLDARRAAGELSAAHAALVAETDDTPAVVAALLAEVDDTPHAVAALLADLGDEDGDYLSKMPPQLKREWLAGGVAARIAWGTPGAFGRCQVIAREKGVPGRQIDGMCANLKRSATGAD